jgi:DNA polymerase III delta subunit
MGVEPALSLLRMLEQRRPLPGVFAICGPQAFLREYVLDALRMRLKRDGRESRMLQVGASGGLDAVLEEIGAADLFAPKKVVVCRIPRARRGQEDDGDTDADSKSGAKGGESALAAAIESKHLAGELILAYERDAVPAKIRRVIERTGIVINCMRPFDNQLAQYAQIFASGLGLKLSADAADLLVSRYAGDLGAIANALAKAALFTEPGARLGAADLMEPGAARMPELFELAESLARGQAPATLAMLDRAIALGRDVFEILAVEIIPVIRRMMLASAMLEQGRNASETASALGLNPASGLLNRAVEGARRFGAQRLARAHRQVCQLDAEFKLGLRREREAALSRLLLDLMAPG